MEPAALGAVTFGILDIASYSKCHVAKFCVHTIKKKRKLEKAGCEMKPVLMYEKVFAHSYIRKPNPQI